MDDYLGSAHIAASARKHGVTDEDIRHALKYYWTSHSTDDPAVAMYVGPSTTALFLEIGVLYGVDRATVIHAMPARRMLLP